MRRGCGVCLHDVDELDEQVVAVRVDVLSQVGPVELGLDGVHHHGRVHVVDPEVLATRVPQLTHSGDRRGLCLRRRQLPDMACSP
jgi:hypothetical protein